LNIDFLANHKHLIPEIARLSYQEWTALFDAAGIDLARLEAMLTERAITDRVPITVVALSDDGRELVGTGSIKMTEPGTREGIGPWLAGILVKPEHRGTGVGAAIVRKLEDKARELGVPTMYLSTVEAEPLYARLGWQVIDRVDSYGLKTVALMRRELQE
jgi:GNAT superfamily N-acetyltransferase